MVFLTNSFSHNSREIKFITRLRFCVSKSLTGAQIHPFCSCGLDIELTTHYLLHCPTYITERRTPLSTIENIGNSLLDLCEPVLIKTLCFGSNSWDTNANFPIFFTF